MASITSCPECGADLPTGMTRGLCPKCLMRAGMNSAAADATAAKTSANPKGFIPPSPAELARRFPSFEILELLGHGGMGAVYKARQKSLDRLVALKIIKPEAAEDPDFAERFGREARALARLNHPNIVAVYDFGQAEGLFFFVMEYVDGANTRQLVAEGQLSPAEALAIVPQICEALQFAHDEGVVHRDIKPENILIDTRGRVKIADFGLAKLLNVTENDFTLTGTHQIVGTPRYMAPEQMEGSHEVDHRADIYSLGVVFYEMLTGELPLGRFQPPSKKVQVDVRLDEVVLRTLEKEPDRRYQKASEVKTDVEAVSRLAEAVLAQVEPANVARPSDEEHRTVMSYLAVGLVLIVPTFALIAFAMWWTRSAWVLAALVMPWFGLGAVGTYADVRKLATLHGAAGWLTVMAFLLTLGVVGMGIWIEQSAWPLTAAAVALVGALAGMGVGSGVADVAESEEEESAGDEAGVEEEEGEEDIDKATAAFENAVGWPRNLMLVVGIIAGINLFSSGLVTGLMRGELPEHQPQLLLLLAPLVLLGVWAMFARQFYPLAIVGAVACLPVGLSSNSAFAQFAPLGIGLWTIVTLLRPDVRAAFGNANSGDSENGSGTNRGFGEFSFGGFEPKPQATPPRGELAQAWSHWWSERDRTLTRTVQAVLVLAHFICLFAFISMSSTGKWDSEGYRAFTYALGIGEPWFTYEIRPDPKTLFRHDIDFFASSMLAVVIGFALYYVFWRIEKVINPRAGFFGSPQCMAIIWCVLALGGIGMGMWMGQQALGETKPGSPAHAKAQAANKGEPAAESTVTSEEIRALLAAAADGQIGRVRQLLADGADVNDKNAEGETALMKAAGGGHVAAVQTLILLGANARERDKEGRTALMHAVENDRPAVIEGLYELEIAIVEVERELREAANRRGDNGGLAERFAELEDDGFGPKRAKSDDELKAMLKRRLGGVDAHIFDEVGLRLPKFHVDTTAQDNGGETALMKAAARGHAACGKALRGWEDEQIQDKQGRTAAMHAAMNGHAAFLRELMALPVSGHGTSVGNYVCHTIVSPKTLAVRDNNNQTAIELATEFGHDDVAVLLIDEMQRAIDHYTRAIEAGGPYSYTYFQRRGWAWSAIGKDDEAAADLKEANARMVRELEERAINENEGSEDEDAGAESSPDSEPPEEEPESPPVDEAP